MTNCACCDRSLKQGEAKEIEYPITVGPATWILKGNACSSCQLRYKFMIETSEADQKQFMERVSKEERRV